MNKENCALKLVDEIIQCFVALFCLNYTHEQRETDIQTYSHDSKNRHTVMTAKKRSDQSVSQFLRYGERCKQRPQLMVCLWHLGNILYAYLKSGMLKSGPKYLLS